MEEDEESEIITFKFRSHFAFAFRMYNNRHYWISKFEAKVPHNPGSFYGL